MDAKNKARFINSVILENEADSSKSKTEEVVAGAVLSESAADVFAMGIPEWDLVPPQIVVRRIRRA